MINSCFVLVKVRLPPFHDFPRLLLIIHTFYSGRHSHMGPRIRDTTASCPCTVSWWRRPDMRRLECGCRSFHVRDRLPRWCCAHLDCWTSAVAGWTRQIRQHNASQRNFIPAAPRPSALHRVTDWAAAVRTYLTSRRNPTRKRR